LIRYTFHLDDSDSVVFETDPNSVTSDMALPQPLPGWMAMQSFRCAHCSLPEDERACPAAVSIWPLVQAFARIASFEDVEAEVQMGQLEMRTRLSAQRAVRSVMGLTMALSACPTMQKLRPMANFHLPFGSKEHVSFRFLGMYLVAQHLRHRKGLPTDWDLDGLLELIDEIHRTNQQIAHRIRKAAENDAVVNSLVFLDALTMSLEHELETSLEHFQSSFFAYLE